MDATTQYFAFAVVELKFSGSTLSCKSTTLPGWALDCK